LGILATQFPYHGLDTAFSHHLEAAYFFNPRCEVLNEQLAQVVEGLEFAGLEGRQMERLGRIFSGWKTFVFLNKRKKSRLRQYKRETEPQQGSMFQKRHIDR